MHALIRLLCLGAALLLSQSAAAQAPRPLYRDPLFDGAADVSLVFNQGLRRWEMFYTNRRAALRLEDPKDVSWVHGTRVSIASTEDGNTWQREGDAEFPSECTGGPVDRSTHWAPEILEHEGVYHLWLTVVPGIHSRWTGTRFLQHLTSTDLRRWHCADQLDLGSQRIIDASVVRLADGRWRLWFKDEAQGSKLFAADSADLQQWQLLGPVTAGAAEGPKVFRFKEQWWLVADLWRGLLVMRSGDAVQWQEQPARLLAEPGRHDTDRAKGQHPDVVVVGGRAFIFYFVHQGNEAAAAIDDRYHQRSVIQVAELKLGDDGWLSVDRDAPPPDLRQLFGSRR
ncbi:hypothetical protein J7U46_03925 [Pelomonas sp. V22]|uniref:hypothetical protein n=1 Tax=Pelomonas sp. V22 TaxID=2822139 RepID=UPI0024A8724E|nr:hypothetical protein [Pelomonas sp. V22]MDI4632189.1 hypothetical protein [Pelomonas sp. V22]